LSNYPSSKISTLERDIKIIVDTGVCFLQNDDSRPGEKICVRQPFALKKALKKGGKPEDISSKKRGKIQKNLCYKRSLL